MRRGESVSGGPALRPSFGGEIFCLIFGKESNLLEGGVWMERPGLPPSGIAGWLILPVLVTFVSALFLSAVVCAIVIFVITYNKEFWPSDGVYPIIAAGWIVACFFLVQKKRAYPKLFIALSGALFLNSLCPLPGL
jgi:hypothetical protein